MFKPLKRFPYVSRSIDTVDDFTGHLRGLDLEWSGENISILGLSDDKKVCSTSYAEHREVLAEMAKDESLEWVGHNIIAADFQELEHDGIHMPTDPKRVHDTIISFWLTNAHLCKTTKGKADEDGSERKGRGFMNLGTMLSLNTDLQHYKECRQVTHSETSIEMVVNKKGDLKPKKVKHEIVDNECVGPCPVHDVFGYNGIDTIGPVMALPSLQFQMRLRDVSKLYPLHVDVANVLAKMSARGVYVNLPYVNKLRDDFNLQKGEYWNPELEAGSLPFNPRSGPKVKEWFKERYDLKLENTQEETIREALEKHEDIPELESLLDFKELGNGPDRWFGQKFLKGSDLLHGRFGFFTSTGRLMSAGPNLQNVAKRRVDRATGENVGKRIRRALIAPEGYWWIKADYSQAENRVLMYLAGIEPPKVDFHSWMAAQLNLDEKSPFAQALGGPRDAGKSVIHATDYLEGLQLIDPRALHDKRIKAEIEAGARIVFPDWTFEGRIVSFTGINLARRALKKATRENRRYALEAQQKYFAALPKIRDVQKMITKQCELNKAVITPPGYYLLSYGMAEDRLKQAAAMWGCLSPETLVLKEDLTWVANGDLKAGDRLVGIEEFPRSPVQHRRMIPSTVLDINPVRLFSYRVETDRGSFVASEDHPWLARTGKGYGQIWIPTRYLAPGSQISYLAEPWQTDESYIAGYLAGSLDGEGTAERLAFHQNQNKMLDVYQEYLTIKGYSNYKLQRKNRSNKRIVLPSIAERISLAGSIRLKRIDTNQLWEGMTPLNGRYLERANVLSVEPVGVKELVGMTTSTHTFVANGMFTHNSNPVAHYMKLALKNASQHPHLDPRVTVHDEIGFYVDRRHDLHDIKKWVEEVMVFDTPEMPGFRIPVEVSYGEPTEKNGFTSNWADQKKIVD